MFSLPLMSCILNRTSRKSNLNMTGRGYTDALFYFNHMNDYYSLNVGQCPNPSGRQL